MPKFVSNRDFLFFQHINSELSDEVVQTNVILYKLSIEYSNTNIYGESTEKISANGVELTCFVDYPDNTAVSDSDFGINQQQNPTFGFVRRILEHHQTYPEIGDIIFYNNLYYEIDNIREVELIASRPEYNNSVLCDAHLTRRSDLQLEPRRI